MNDAVKELGQAGNKSIAADSMALTRLLIEKGVFSYDEYMLEREAAAAIAEHAAEIMPKVIELVMDENASKEKVESLLAEVSSTIKDYLETGKAP